MEFHEVQFPTDVSYGAAGGPGFNTNLPETDTGVVEPVSRWSGPRHRYNAAYNIKSHQTLAAVKTFYIARNGPAIGFRYKDWHDYHSNPADPTFNSAKGTRDQLIGTGNGAQTVFSLVKSYTSGLVTRTRRITKPVNGTVQVWVNAVLKTEGVDYTIDYTTGDITFSAAVTNGHDVEASFEFDVPVHFAAEVDELLSASIDSFGDGAVEDIPLVEVVNPEAGYVSEYFYGGAYEVSSAADLVMSTGRGRYWVVSMTTTGKSVSLPDPTSIPPGGPIFFLENAGSNTFALKNHTGSTMVNLTAGSQVEVLLTRTSGGTLVWCAA